jgi:hypothetical protein
MLKMLFRDGNRSGLDRVEQKHVHDSTCEVYLNPLAITLTGVIPTPHPNPSDFGSRVSFYLVYTFKQYFSYKRSNTINIVLYIDLKPSYVERQQNIS